MKKLNKKISIGVLIAGLLMGGAAFSGIGLAHADSVSVKEQVDDDLFEGIELIGESEWDESEFDKYLDEMSAKASIKEEDFHGRKSVFISFKK